MVFHVSSSGAAGQIMDCMAYLQQLLKKGMIWVPMALKRHQANSAGLAAPAALACLCTHGVYCWIADWVRGSNVEYAQAATHMLIIPCVLFGSTLLSRPGRACLASAGTATATGAAAPMWTAVRT